MEKIIATKKTFKTNDFKITIGSMNKKNPATFYVELNSFVEPIKIKNKYNDIILKLNKETEKYLNNIVSENNLSSKYLKDIKYSTDSLEKKNKSYLSLSFVFMQQPSEIKQLTFPEIYDKMSETFDDEHNKLKDIFQQNNLNICLR